MAREYLPIAAKNRVGPTLTLRVMVVLLMLPTTALGYIEPGTGSFVIQGIIAAILGFGVTAKVFWKRIKAAISRKSIARDDHSDA